MTLNHTDMLVITGAAGLVGQNLVAELLRQGYTNLVALDNHAGNLAILQRLHPQVRCVHADLSEPGPWEDALAGAARLFLLQAQITSADWAPFQRNTLDATKRVIAAAQKHAVPFTVFVGSSVVNSVADDNYTRSKRGQEALMAASGLPHCVARPTLMFGWFDPKHLGWLSRFMAKTPVFPIPGSGRFLRQPLYVLDFCRVLIRCAEMAPSGAAYDIVGQEDVTYVDIVRSIRRAKGLHTLLVHLPIWFFRLLMRTYALLLPNPPFVADQLDALTAGDYFRGISIKETFGVTPTPFAQAITETFTHPVYSAVVLERWT
ncbi:MAG: NAD-dependent dehydratase [Desulfovibrionaceae bacterium CG1_02_65_16]|nr:MAG: NAD-dependent dehydratase [Desulfovibrionaceae bacterium CG1_02_65_16]